MNRYCGFIHGRFGDAFIATVAARALKTMEPDCHLTFTIGWDYREAAPLFLNHPHIDRIRINHSVRAEGWNDQRDIEWIKAQRFDHVFNPLADHNHSVPWFTQRHQTEEMCHIHGIPSLPGFSPKIEMVKWFDVTPNLSNAIAFSPFSGWYAGLDPSKNPKTLSLVRANQIVAILLKRGHEVLQVGAPNEPVLQGAARIESDYFTSVRNILGCRAFIGGDTGMSWLLSGYDFPVLGLYSHDYHGEQNVSSIQPINPSATYLSARNVNDISDEQIGAVLDKLSPSS